jgi:hypothetical protein
MSKEAQAAHSVLAYANYLATTLSPANGRVPLDKCSDGGCCEEELAHSRMIRPGDMIQPIP